MRHVARIAAALILVAATAEAQELAGTFDQLRVLVKPGDTLTVTDAAGQRVRGKVVSLSNSVLNLTVSGTPREFLSTDVNIIAKRGADSLRNGALIGLAIGGGLGALAGVAMAVDDGIAGGFAAVAAMMYGGIGAGIGTGIDALIEGDRVIYARSRSAGITLTVAPIISRQHKGARVSLRF